MLEELAEDCFDEVDHLVEEKTEEQHVEVDLAQPTVETSRLARVSTQVARLDEETAEDVIKELSVEITEVQVREDLRHGCSDRLKRVLFLTKNILVHILTYFIIALNIANSYNLHPVADRAQF